MRNGYLFWGGVLILLGADRDAAVAFVHRKLDVDRAHDTARPPGPSAP
jgi:hypothetical protein